MIFEEYLEILDSVRVRGTHTHTIYCYDNRTFDLQTLMCGYAFWCPEEHCSAVRVQFDENVDWVDRTVDYMSEFVSAHGGIRPDRYEEIKYAVFLDDTASYTAQLIPLPDTAVQGNVIRGHGKVYPYTLVSEKGLTFNEALLKANKMYADKSIIPIYIQFPEILKRCKHKFRYKLTSR